MKKTALILMVVTLFTKVIGFARDITLSYFYGASNISDAYLIADTIPIIILAFIGSGIATSYIPLYCSIEKESGTELADKFTNNITNLIVILCSVIILMTLVFTVPIVKLFASGFEGETLKIAVGFTRISIFGIFFSGLIYIFCAYLHLKNNFVLPALRGIPYSFIIIISIILSSIGRIEILPIGSVIAVAFQLFLLIPYIYMKGYRYSLAIDGHDKNLRKMVYLSLPVIIGVSVNQINVLVDRTIASQVAIGGISALTYANRLNLFIQGIFVVSIATVMYPMISKMAAENNVVGIKKSLSEAIGGINLLVVPATLGTMIFVEPIIKMLFGRGAFDSQAVSMTSYALFFYSIGMVGFGIREVLSRVFYSLQDTKTPMKNAAIAMLMNIVLNIILSKFLGIGGLALATSLSAIVCTVLLFISLRKKIGSFDMKNISISFAKILIASFIMGIIAKLTYNLLLNNTSTNLSLVVSMGIGALVYFVIIYSMKIEVVEALILGVKKRLN